MFLIITNYFWPFFATFLLGVIAGLCLAVFILKHWMPAILNSVFNKLKEKKDLETPKTL